MENAIAASLSKQIALSRAMNVTANNIANQTTAGFKADRILFREYLTSAGGATKEDTDLSLVFDQDAYTDFSAGGIEATYGDLDFAIDGEGFFGVETVNGPRYTRDGRFSISPFGELVTREGDRVLDTNGSTIFIDVNAGPLLVSASGELQQAGAPIAQLGIFEFSDQRQIRKEGSGLFSASEEPTTKQNPTIRQGFIETSNVASIVAVTDMIDIMRAYEQAARVVEMSDELARNAISTLSDTA